MRTRTTTTTAPTAPPIAATGGLGGSFGIDSGVCTSVDSVQSSAYMIEHSHNNENHLLETQCTGTYVQQISEVLLVGELNQLHLLLLFRLKG